HRLAGDVELAAVRFHHARVGEAHGVDGIKRQRAAGRFDRAGIGDVGIDGGRARLTVNGAGIDDVQNVGTGNDGAAGQVDGAGVVDGAGYGNAGGRLEAESAGAADIPCRAGLVGEGCVADIDRSVDYARIVDGYVGV